jgi:thioredoxin-related protein
MKKTILFAIYISISILCNAQMTGDTVPAYKRLPTIPPFKIMVAPDSTLFTRDDLKKKKAAIIMVFSPDCEHCIISTKDLLPHYDLFKNVQIIMVSALPFGYVKKFYEELKIADYPNIKVGEDKNYFLGSFYQVRSFPSIYLYNKKAKFKQVFDPNIKWETIAKFL